MLPKKDPLMVQIDLRTKLTKLGENIRDLPTLPVVANNIIQITQNPKSSALEVGKAISQDQALTSKVLRMANSAYYGFPQKITTINHAIVILGFASIRNLVLAVSVFDMFSKRSGNFDRGGFWKHSLACGVTAKLIAKRLGINNFEEIFISGLIHDLGKLVLDAYFGEEFTRVIDLVKVKGIPIREAEQELLGLDHAAVGGILANKWNLPPQLLKVIRFHHNPPQAGESMRVVAIVHVADVLCRAAGIGNGGDCKVPCVNEQSWKLVSLNKRLLVKLFSEVEIELAVACELLTSAK
ncbi:MAG TPA: HDOD domain-containing protein [Proteobacteria bacterium]|mgnify:CR=1 FL=1|nr:HDOD domain-containing protein [Pseudomonadota bacterium]